MNPLNTPPDPSEVDLYHLPISDILDLFSIPPRDAKAVLEAWLEQVQQHHYPAIRVIHGRGIGVQREMVRNVLSRTPFVISFSDAPAEAGGWGSTIATLSTSQPKDPMPTTEADRLRADLDTVRRESEQLIAPLSDSQWNWRASPKAWSVGQCVDHLAITDRLYAGTITKAIAEARRQNLTASGPFSYPWLDRLFVWIIGPPVRLRFPAPPSFRPSPEPRSVPRSVVNSYLEGNLALQQLAKDADGLDFARIRLTSPASESTKLSLGTAFLAMIAHNRRHLWQAQKIIAQPGFPKA